PLQRALGRARGQRLGAGSRPLFRAPERARRHAARGATCHRPLTDPPAGRPNPGRPAARSRRHRGARLLTATAADSFANLLRATLPAKRWIGGSNTYLSTTQSALYYDSLKVTHSNLSAVATGGPRQVLVALIRPNGYLANAAWFRIYSIHFKAGNGATTPS